MKLETTLDKILKDAKSKSETNAPDSYESYKRKNGIEAQNGYAAAVGALYAAMKKNLASYGVNSGKLANKGLQNSGYADYIDSLSESKFKSGLGKTRAEYISRENDAKLGYAGYLEEYRDKQAALKKSVMSYLVDNDVVSLDTAIEYGIGAGLSREDAEQIGKSAYELTKQKVFNSVLEQTVQLGLDKEGARQLAVKMGVSESDALSFAEEIGKMLEYYGTISKEYLDFLEERSK